MLSLRRSSTLVLALGLVLGLTAMGCSGDDDNPAGPQLDTDAPAVPAGVTASVTDAATGTVVVSWEANSTDADLAGYVVYRSQDPQGGYLPVDGSLVQTNRWTDVGAPFGANYYRIAARDAAANESAMSSPTGVNVQIENGDEPPRVSN